MGLLATLVAGCGRGPILQLRYRVDFAHRSGDAIPVTLEIDGASGDSLALDGFTPAALMRLDSVRVDAGGAAGVTVGERRNGPNGESDATVVLRRPARQVTLRYVVHLGVREGNAHTGYTGRASGFVTDRYAFATGRALFLAPRDAGRVRAVQVEFALPQGWTSVTPWRATAPASIGIPRAVDTFAPGLPGASPVQDLVWSALGFGHFDERTVDLAGTSFRFAWESGIDSATADSTIAMLTAEARAVLHAMGRGLGASFTTVIVPENPNGDEAIADGWVDGYGGTLAPITTARAHDFADDLVAAYVQPGPYRTAIRDAGERWIGDAVAQWLPWRALDAAGLSRPEDLERRLSVDFAKPIEEDDTTGVVWNLERYGAGTAEGARYARETLAPIALLRVGDALRAESGGQTTLDDLTARLFGTRTAPSLWTLLPNPSAPRWRALRARYVQGGGRLEADTLLAPQPRMTDAPTGSAAGPPAAAARTPSGSLVLAATGNTYGYLENCGCTVNQAGGMARRATVFDEIARGTPFVALDAGNALARAERPEPPDTLAQEEQRLYLRLMGELGYPVGAPGPSELAYGLDRFRDAVRAATFPFLLANARSATGPLAAPWRVVRAGPFRLGVVGLMEPGRGPWANDVLERRLGDAVAFEDPVSTLQRLEPEVRRAADLVVAIGFLSPPTVRRLVREVPDLDVVISSDDAQGTLVDDDGSIEISTSDAPGFIGHTLVLYTVMGSFGVSGATIHVGAGGRIAAAEPFQRWLGDTIPEHPKIRGELTRFYQQVGGTRAALASVQPLFADDPVRMAGPYAGAAKCQSCHAAEYAQWKSTGHAGAMKTLLDVHRNDQPRCVMCHVVGFRTPTGYQFGDATDRLANVQCEVCHGPGAAHAAAPSTTNIQRRVPASVCLQCHTPDHSEHFVYAEKLPRVVHRSR